MSKKTIEKQSIIDLVKSVANALVAVTPKERTLSYADYLALTEEEKMNGTNYYCPDAPGGGGGISASPANVINRQYYGGYERL